MTQSTPDCIVLQTMCLNRVLFRKLSRCFGLGHYPWITCADETDDSNTISPYKTAYIDTIIPVVHCERVVTILELSETFVSSF